MPITDIPILSMLHTRMQWHQVRQEVLAENIANADTPNYQAQDVVPPDFSQQLAMVTPVGLATTDPNHIAVQAGGDESSFAADHNQHYEIRPRGNGVNHEDEMMKLGNNQMDYEAVTAMYTHSLGLIKIALDR
ncbi:MAG TPA: flagellar basal body rod protein FlgB [Xanthobacteraceae bacterium]|jgi:flagellar basal-body rod protein FlgB|nr:flagellar basal body rod protein FlgB [Xanthobacteraceae bacterium]